MLWYIRNYGHRIFYFFYNNYDILFVFIQAAKENIQETGSQGEEDKQEEEIEELDGDGRRRRKRKVPKRYIKIKLNNLNVFELYQYLMNICRFMEAVQGKELERIFKEEGVIDEEDDDDTEIFDDSEEPLNTCTQDGQEGFCNLKKY